MKGEKMRMRNNGRNFMFCLILLVSIFKCQSTAVDRTLQEQSRVQIRNGPLQVSIDPRLELISILQYISAFMVSGYRLLTDYCFEYREGIDRYFASRTESVPSIKTNTGSWKKL